MHAAMDRWNATQPEHRLTLHIGVNTGHGIARVVGSEVRMDYAVLGDAVILAQRLESVTPPQETYVGDTTKRLSEHRFEFESTGDLHLKGRKQAEVGWRLMGRRQPSAGDHGARR